ncbi:hypothetical protein BGY98DRAFT_1097805 [Russula aff. rugulosa BPL654]|nr:hypothetical protein BGY98DRAFT_1097805 [Russula aff. rugulosa BPL654]
MAGRETNVQDRLSHPSLPPHPNPMLLSLDTRSGSQRAHTPQIGDLAALGLAVWSPAGLSSWMLELIDASMRLPWFHTFIAGTLFFCLLLLTFSIKQLHNSAALAPQ